MRPNGTRDEIRLLEELMHDKEAIFRTEIEGLQKRVSFLTEKLDSAKR